MELKKAVEVLNKLEFEDYEYTYNGLYHNIDTILIKQAIDTVLEELNNRIPRKDIEDIYNELKKVYEDELNKLGMTMKGSALDVLEYILNKYKE